jgi:membrane-associated phospholipid phosphatase
MSVQAGIGASSNYAASFFAVLRRSTTQLVRPPSHSRRAEAARRLARHSLLITAMVGAAIIALMYGLDVAEIGLMPPRGTASLWPVRILTDFGKDAYVLLSLAGMLLVVAVIAAALRGTAQSRWLGLGTRLQFLFFAVLAPVLAGAVIKWIAGRGRPFVGGKADAFNFAPFAGTEAHASFPSAHAITAVALAFAVAAVWPRARVAMMVYALAIAVSRLVLLAHHPSDVVAGALIGVVGAMLVRYWFAARRLGFTIHRDGRIVTRGEFSG